MAGAGTVPAISTVATVVAVDITEAITEAVVGTGQLLWSVD
jgi:hypothetical protein